MARSFISDTWPIAKALATKIPPLHEINCDEILIFGCGDSYYAALAIEYAFSEWTSYRVRAANSMTASRYLIPRYAVQGLTPLLVGISSSGEVSRTIEALEVGIESGATGIALTNNDQGQLARSAQFPYVLDIPELPVGPGLLSYLASLMGGFAIASANADDKTRAMVDNDMKVLLSEIEVWYVRESQRAKDVAESSIEQRDSTVFIGSGPAHSSALFASAKLIEAAGMHAWANELEEWSHIEFFCDPPDMVTWILSSNGRASSREGEVRVAAEAIGRKVIVSQWMSESDSHLAFGEVLSPLALWAGPAAYAAQLAEKFNQLPFRNFGGGRSREGGGGISRIRTSEQIHSVNELIERT